MNKTGLPSVFSDLEPLVDNIREKIRGKEWSSTCPYCGGDDRFVIMLSGHGGFPWAFCRHEPDNHNWHQYKNRKPTKDEFEEYKRNQIEVENARIANAKRTIEILQNDKLWDIFFHNNNEWSRSVFKEWGIADSWVEYLQLGIIPDYSVKSDGEFYHSPAFSIPVWGAGGIVQNIKLRIANPRSDRDRYRNYYSTGQSFLFVPLYDLPLEGKCVLVEGEKKAIVMEQTLDDMNYRVVGLQSKTPSETILKQLKDFEVVYIGLDPDAFVLEQNQGVTAVQRLTNMIGKERVRIVEFPCKPDDGIVKHGLDPMRYINMARKA